MAKKGEDLDFAWQSVDPSIPYTVRYEGRVKAPIWAEPKPEEQKKSPCVSYVIVNGTTYLDMERSLAGSPFHNENMILAASRRSHGEVPILSGLEKKIVEEKRMAARMSGLSATATN